MILKEGCPVTIYWREFFVDGKVMFGLELPLSKAGSSPRRVCPIGAYELMAWTAMNDDTTKH